MNGKRIIFIFGLFLAFFSVILGNLFLLSSNIGFAENVYNQTNFKLPVFNGRGTIYDFNLTPLTNTSFTNLVLALPGEQDYTSLFDFVKEEDKKTLYKALQTNSPCLVNLKNTNEDDILKNAYIFKQPQRYQNDPIAEHLIGYVNSDGVGVSGIEFAFDEELKNAQDKTFVCCKTNARGALQVGEIPYLSSIQGTGQDVVLTIDDTIQRLCEAQAQQKMEKGSIVVIDVKTGRIKASVSVPSFDPTNINKSIENGDTSLINRATCEFNVGSIFKPLLAAVALENGIDEKETYTCKGYIEVGDHVYRCANFVGHGDVDLKKALEDSCNCYFVDLGQKLGGDAIFDFANMVGFGKETQLGGGYQSKSGNLPTKDELQNLGQLASVSFGQGELLATPIQIAAYFNTFANNGVYVSPSLVEGLLNPRTGKIEKSFYHPVQVKAMSDTSAEMLKEMLTSVVLNGLAKKAKPTFGLAAGKTGTAQTGRYFTEENGNEGELYESWFVGFYPVDEPQYTICILEDETHTIKDGCSEIFAEICNSLYYLDQKRI